MKHLTFFLYFIAFNIGITNLIITVILFSRARREMFFYYLFFYSAFSLEMMKNIGEFYLEVTGLNNIFDNFMWLQNIEILTQPILILSILIFTNYFFKVKKRLIINIICIIVIVITVYISIVIPQNIVQNFKILNNMNILKIFLHLTILYFIIMGIIFYRRLKEETDRKLLKKILIITCIFTPAIIIEAFDIIYDALFENCVPVLYGIIGIITINHIIKYYLNNYFITSSDIKMFQNSKSKSFFNIYNISDREKDVIMLVLKGYSNNKISNELFISMATVKSHIYNIFKKTGVNNRYELFYKMKQGDGS